MDARAHSNWVATIRRFVNTKASAETCELCSKPLPLQHRHLLEISTRRILCACEGCAFILGTGARFRAVYPLTTRLSKFHVTDSEWESMQLPIDIVFFFLNGDGDRATAIYPGPAGAMESALSAHAWDNLLTIDPSLADMAPHVEALLINRTRNARDYFRVSIDRCYALVGLIRTRWRGVSGGQDVWNGVSDFFDSLDQSAVIDPGSCIHG